MDRRKILTGAALLATTAGAVAAAGLSKSYAADAGAPKSKQSANNLTLEKVTAIQAACTQLVVKYGYYADTGVLAEKFEEIFTSDAKVVKPDLGVSVQGRENFSGKALGGDKLASPNPTVKRTSRHVVGTPCFLSTTAEEVTAATYLTFWLADPNQKGQAQAEGPAGIITYLDRFKLTPVGWRIADRTTHMGIRGPGNNIPE